jgi:hypothetical protein
MLSEGASGMPTTSFPSRKEAENAIFPISGRCASGATRNTRQSFTSDSKRSGAAERRGCSPVFSTAYQQPQMRGASPIENGSVDNRRCSPVTLRFDGRTWHPASLTFPLYPMGASPARKRRALYQILRLPDTMRRFNQERLWKTSM